MRHGLVILLAAALLFGSCTSARTEEVVLEKIVVEVTPPKSAAGQKATESPEAWITITVPAGIDVTVQSGTVVYETERAETVATGSPRV